MDSYDRRSLGPLYHELVEEQNEHRRVYGGAVRIIRNNDLLVVEYALRTVMVDESSLPIWAYQTARQYAEDYNTDQGTGLVSSSVPLLQDIADFWMQEFGLDLETLTAPAKEKKDNKKTAPATGSKKAKATGKQKGRFPPRQGQFLAFIHLYRKLHRHGPAEHDLVNYFRVTPSSVHKMVVQLEELGLITREPGVLHAVRVAIPEAEIPPLQNVEGPAW